MLEGVCFTLSLSNIKSFRLLLSKSLYLLCDFATYAERNPLGLRETFGEEVIKMYLEAWETEGETIPQPSKLQTA